MSNHVCPSAAQPIPEFIGYIKYAVKAAGLTKVSLIDKLEKYLGIKVDQHTIRQYKCESCSHKFFP
jgi:hypothetical protein